MKIGLLVDNVNIFDYKKNRDFYTYRWYVLQQLFEQSNIKLVGFSDVDDANKYELIIENGLRNCNYDNKYLLIIESKLIRPNDWNINLHQKYKKIFCWDDDLVDNKKYFKLNYAFDIPRKIPKKFYDKKLCCTIAGNKFANHPDELYTKRVELIRWFEENHLDDFDLYGTGWDEYRFGHSFLGKVLNRVKFLRKKDLFSSYKGMVESKNETMQKYKFAICYENIKEQNGYITEKIFDCFFAGCIPIYWGAKNITEHIPKECFVDKREFNSFEELYDYMANMDEGTYMNYLDEIEKFLNSKKADPFRAEVFAETIVSEILKDIKYENK